MNPDHLYVTYVGGSAPWQVYELLTGIDRRNTGPRHATPKQAYAFIASMAGIAETSPLRSRSAGDSTIPLGGGVGDATHQPSEVGSRETPAIASGAGMSDAGPTAADGFWPSQETVGG